MVTIEFKNKERESDNSVLFFYMPAKSSNFLKLRDQKKKKIQLTPNCGDNKYILS